MPQGSPWIIVPYRDNALQQRAAQLRRFVGHMNRYHPDWRVIVVEQDDDGRKFNRGALLNFGARFAQRHGASYVVFHDVDLLPLAAIVPYYTAVPSTGPIHIGKAWTHKYDYEAFLGGVLSISMDHLRASNGFPNDFWGWGGEDDAIRERMKRVGLMVLQPTLRGRGFTELTHADTKQQPEMKNMRKWEGMAAERRGQSWRHNGFGSVRARVLHREHLTESAVKVTVHIQQ